MVKGTEFCVQPGIPSLLRSPHGGLHRINRGAAERKPDSGQRRPVNMALDYEKLSSF